MKTVWIACPTCEGRKEVMCASFPGDSKKYPLSKEPQLLHPSATVSMEPCPKCEGTGKIKWGWIEE